VCHGEGLQDPADRLAGLRLQKEMEMVRHQALAEQPERIAGTGIPQRLEEGFIVAVLGENVGSVVTTTERVIN
jgi:hypothetical protein